MIVPPVSETPSALTDWVEASGAFTEADGYVARAEILTILEQSGQEDPEQLESVIRRHAELRRRYGGDAYPFEITPGGYRMRGAWAGHLPYSFMLLVSLNQHYPQLRFRRGTASRVAVLFELLSQHAVRCYCSGHTVRLGAPRRTPAPASFPAAVDYLAQELLEERGGSQVTTGDEKDDGLDIVGWIPFLDRRPGQVVILAQCAIGVDWNGKLPELSEELWRDHISWHVVPIRAFIVPFHHDEGVGWRRSSREGGIVFDRLRVTSCLGTTQFEQEFSEDVRRWCRQRIKRLPRYR
jgi:hypothetical protein